MAEEQNQANTGIDIDYKQLSDADLQALASGQFDALSTRGRDIVTGNVPEALVPKISRIAGEAVGAIATGVPQVTRDVYDWTRGAKVQYSQVPILGQGIGAKELGLPPAATAQLMTLVSTTLDPARLEEGIKNIDPNATTIRDNFGNVIASIPIKKNGVLQGYKTFYPNPRGLDIPTMTQLSGAVALAPLVEAGVAGVGIPAQLGLRTGATALTEAAIGETTSAASAETPMEPSVIVEGGAWGSGMYGLGKALGFIADKIGNVPSWFRNPARTLDRNAQLSSEAVKYLKSVGIDPDQVQASVYSDLEGMIRGGAVPEAALAKMQAQGLPVPVPLTTGQISGDMEQQLFEDLAAKGVYGEQAKNIVSGAYAAQEAAVKENIGEIQRIIAGGGPTVARTEGGAAAQAALVAAKKAARKRADNLYTQARAAGAAYLDPTTAATYGEEIITSLANRYNPLAVPITTDIVNKIDEAFQTGASLSDIEVYRTQLANQARNGAGSDASAAGAAVQQLDDKLYQMAEQNLLYGNNEAVGLWANAIQNYRQFKDKWESQGGILNRLTKDGVQDGSRVLTVAPEAAARTILTGSFSGLISKPESIRMLNTLKNELPAAEWDMLRQDAFMQISDGIVSASTGRTSNTFSREFFDANRRNPQLLRTLFSPEEIRIMNSLAQTTSQITRTAKNTSNSAAAAGSLLGRLFRSMGSTDVGTAVMQLWGTEAVRRAYGVARASAATQGRVPTTKSLLERTILGGGIGAGMTPEQEEAPPEPTAPPQARALPPAPSTRGLGTMLQPPAPGGAPAPAASPAPGAVAQGPVGPSSREMLQDLFPFDTALRAG
jgi:hypothetical protein